MDELHNQQLSTLQSLRTMGGKLLPSQGHEVRINVILLHRQIRIIIGWRRTIGVTSLKNSKTFGGHHGFNVFCGLKINLLEIKNRTLITVVVSTFTHYFCQHECDKN